MSKSAKDPHIRSEIVQVRVSPSDKKLIAEAAALDRRTVSSFILIAAVERARAVIDAHKPSDDKTARRRRVR